MTNVVQFPVPEYAKFVPKIVSVFDRKEGERGYDLVVLIMDNKEKMAALETYIRRAESRLLVTSLADYNRHKRDRFYKFLCTHVVIISSGVFKRDHESMTLLAKVNSILYWSEKELPAQYFTGKWTKMAI